MGGATEGGEAVSSARTRELREGGHQGAVAQQRGSGEVVSLRKDRRELW